jgi:membrane protease YdiL (CAAX protease family)
MAITDMDWIMRSALHLAMVSPGAETSQATVGVLAFAVVVFVCAGCLMWRLLRRATSPDDARNAIWRVGPKPWTMADLGLGVVWVLTVIITLGAVMGAVSRLTGEEATEPGPLVTLGLQLVLYVVIGVGIVLFMRHRQVGIRDAFGLGRTIDLPAVGWGVVFCFAFLPLIGLTAGIVDTLYEMAGIEQNRQTVVNWYLEHKEPVTRLMIGVFAVIVAPIAEECFFRGLVYPTIKQRYGVVTALLVASVGFAMIHGHLPSLAPLFVLGLGLALAYEWTGSVLTPIVMHAAFNGLTLVSMIRISNGL